MSKNASLLPEQIFRELVQAAGAEPVTAKFTLDSPSVRCGTDDFEIVASDRVIRFAGGNIRGLIYAVYEYFERYCCCRWFWDGDAIPKRNNLPLDNIYYIKRFRRKYRGLRYFAHRSLSRFQAEHWDFKDWKREIDFLLKKHFSFFMLRIGNDDLFQKAFPGVVKYPPLDGSSPEAVERSYNDRTELISLQYRSELRKKVLGYAFERGLMHPEDIGPTTHWYNVTPKDFLEHFKPEFMDQSSQNYMRPETQVWNCDNEVNIDRYLKLTWAHIRHYGRPELFHIIGLAERVFGSKEENYATKVRIFRAFVRKLRKRYPNAPLLVASWDFMFRWEAAEVRCFLQELDPENTIILDYTSDSDYHTNHFVNWNLPDHFPWIFGIFQAYEPQNDLFFDFDRMEKMYAISESDSMCKGMVLWSENSHSNPLLLEYLAKKSADETFLIEQFCRDRYGDFAKPMAELWTMTKVPFAANAWVFDKERPYHGIFCNHFNLLATFSGLGNTDTSAFYCECARKYPMLEIPETFFAEAAALAETTDSEWMRRDLGDLLRTALMCLITRELCAIGMKLLGRTPKKVDGSKLVSLIRLMGDLLETLPEFSLNCTLAQTGRGHTLNPHAEMTLKGNAENSYCRSYIYELYRAIYEPEAIFLSETLAKLPAGKLPPRKPLLAKANNLKNHFYVEALARYQPCVNLLSPKVKFPKFSV
ncbi:MAG: alpha-N-acetylglucosaminidase TIM-barrel domain-containing protein [Lentisphaeria bacterium]